MEETGRPVLFLSVKSFGIRASQIASSSFCSKFKEKG